MKKLLIIMTLFMSSFFLFCNKEVKAYELQYEVDLSLLDDNFYTFKNAVEDFIKDDTIYSDKYIIYKYGSNLDMHAVVLPLDSTYNPNVIIFSSYLQSLFQSSGQVNRLSPSSNYTIATLSGTISYYQNYTYTTATNLNSMRFIPLYANFDIIMSQKNQGSTVTYIYNDFSTVNIADGVDTFKTLYIINKEYQEYVGNNDLVHREELEKVESFYIMVIEKLGYLAETITSNYIYLSIIVIFILTFIALLIFRRFL